MGVVVVKKFKDKVCFLNEGDWFWAEDNRVSKVISVHQVIGNESRPGICPAAEKRRSVSLMI